MLVVRGKEKESTQLSALEAEVSLWEVWQSSSAKIKDFSIPVEKFPLVQCKDNHQTLWFFLPEETFPKRFTEITETCIDRRKNS